MVLQKFNKEGLTFRVESEKQDSYSITVAKQDIDVFNGLYPTINDLKRNFVLVQELFLGKAKVKLDLKNATTID